MSKRIVLVVVLGAAAALSSFLYLRSIEQELRGGPVARVLVAREPLPAGAKTSDKTLALRDVPQAYVHPQAIGQKEAREFLGRTLEHALQKGQPVLKTDLSDELSSTEALSHLIPKGMRAFTIPVDGSSSMSGLLRSGDHVDVLGTFARDGQSERATVTLLQNVEVLATDAPNDESSKTNQSFHHVTLCVSLEDATLLAFAVKRGSLHTVLRQAGDEDVISHVAEKSLADILEPTRRAPSHQKTRTIESLRPRKAR